MPNKKNQPTPSAAVSPVRLMVSASLAAPLLVGTFTINLLGLALPLAALQVYDRVLAQGAHDSWVLLCLVVFIAAVAEAALRLARATLMAWHGARHEQSLMQQQFTHLLQADPHSVLRHGPAGHLQTLDGLIKLREFNSGQALVVLIEVPFILVYLALVALLGGWLVLMPLGWLLLFTGRMAGQSQQLEDAFTTREQADVKRFGGIIEMLGQIHTVKALGALRQLQRQTEARQLHTSTAALQVARISNLAYQDGLLFGQLVLVSLVMAGAPLAVAGQLSLGALMACILLGGRLMVPVQRALGCVGRLREVRMAHQNLEQALAVPAVFSTAESAATGSLERSGNLILRNVSLLEKHGGPNTQQSPRILLNNINLQLAPGSITVLEAPHEADAESLTALLQLMAGLRVPDGGEVLLNGTAPHQLPAASLLQHVAYLPPLGTIYQASIYNNLSRFGQTPTLQVAELASLLGLAETIAHLPQGYQTQLENTLADPLPPGMKQRLALARSLALKPRLILFNHADRALDRTGYNLVFQLLARLRGRATLVLVTNDLNLRHLATSRYQLAHGQLTPVTAIITSIGPAPDNTTQLHAA